MTNQWQHSDAIFEELERSIIVIKGKPANIILQPRWYITLLDYDSSCFYSFFVYLSSTLLIPMYIITLFHCLLTYP